MKELHAHRSRTGYQLSRRTFVAALAAGAAVGSGAGGKGAAAGAEPSSAGNIRLDPEPDPAENLSLAERARRKGLIFGAAELQGALVDNPEYQAAIARDCGLLATENELKFLDLRRYSPKFDFTPADWLLKFAQDNNMLFSGHVLCWGLALPKWAKETPPGKPAHDMLVDHIWSVASRYRGRMHSWDTVNEAVEPYDRRPDLLRENYWMKALGPDYIELAFRTASDADPSAILFYNDYALENSGDYYDRRREGTLKLLDKLVSKKVPIHALGVQSHLPSTRGKWFAEKEFMSFLDSVHGLGLRTMITELDVSEHTLPTNIAERDHWVASIAGEFLAATVEHPSLSEIVTWGFSDKYTYRNEFNPRPDGFPSRPLPIDSAYQRKPLWRAIARALDAAPARPPMTAPVSPIPTKKTG